MAELLIYNAGCWMDKLTSEDWEVRRTRCPDWDQKYVNRWQRGHVVEVRPDGFWSDAGVYPRADVFRVVLVPGLTVESAQTLLEPGISGRRKCRVLNGEGQVLHTVRVPEALQLSEEQ